MSNNAASRVFAIPELLEQILLEVAGEPKRFFADDGSIIELPTSRLTAVERVHSTLRNTIADSKSLRKAMLRLPPRAGDFPSTSLAEYVPLLWLLQFMSLGKAESPIKIEEDCPARGQRTIVFELRTYWLYDERYWYPSFKKDSLENQGHKDAAWRRLPISTSATNTRLRFLHTVRFMHKRTFMPWAGDLPHADLYRGVLEVDTEEEKTLGDVFDKLIGIAKRSTKEHREARDDYIDHRYLYD